MKIGLGTAQFGMDYGITNRTGCCSVKDVHSILDHAFNNNVKIIDTASSYGNSEKTLGACILPQHEFTIVTKTPHFSNTDQIKNKLLASFADSLQRMQVDYIYGLLIHNVKDLFAPYGSRLWSEMLELKYQGKVKKIGVSVYTPQQIDQVIENYNVDIVQVPFNIMDQRLLRNGYLNKLKSLNIEIHARSIFLQGLLLIRPEELNGYFSQFKLLFNKFYTDCLEMKYTPLQVALNFVLQQKEIDIALTGVSSYKDFKEIIEAAHLPAIITDYHSYASDDEKLINPIFWKTHE